MSGNTVFRKTAFFVWLKSISSLERMQIWRKSWLNSLNTISLREVQRFDLTNHKLRFSLCAVLLQTHELACISGSECLKLACEFCISKDSDSYPHGTQLFQKYGLLRDPEKRSAVSVCKLNVFTGKSWEFWYCNKLEVWAGILISSICCEKFGIYN